MNNDQTQNQKDIVNDMLDMIESSQLHQTWRERREARWSRMYRARREYTWREGFTFTNWLEQKYGIQPILDRDGNITADYNIVDEKKYSFYLLKFS